MLPSRVILRRFLVAIALAVGSASPLLADDPLRIGTITIHALDVYSESEARRGAVYRLADTLHIETHTVTQTNTLANRATPSRSRSSLSLAKVRRMVLRPLPLTKNGAPGM